MLLFPDNFPEFCQNFGFSVLMNMNKKKNYIFKIFFYKVLFVGFRLLVLKELKNTHNTRFS